MSFSAAITLVLSLVSAQNLVSLAGNITTSQGEPSSTYAVEIASTMTHQVIDRAYSDTSGKFELHNIPDGAYTITVRTEDGVVLGFQDVFTERGTGPVRIRISEPSTQRPIAGTVSTSALLHHPPKKAIREMNLAIRASRASDSNASLQHLLEAIRIDPDFSEAHTNLGAEYARSGKFVEAYFEFTTALRLGPKGAVEYCNLGVAAMGLNRYQEAENNARAALRIDSRSSQANYVLGKLLAAQPGHRDEAVRHLKLAAADIPSANSLLAKISR